MGLKRIVTDLELVPEAARGLYVEDGDSFKLNDDFVTEGMVDATEVTGLKRKNDELLAAQRKLKDTYDGIDPEEYKKFAESREQAEREKQKLAGDFDARERQLLERHKAEVEKSKAEAERLNGTLHRLMVDNEAQAALVGARAKKVGGMGLLMPHITSRAKVVDEDGRHVTRIYDEMGQVRLSTASGSAQPMTIAELVAEMRDSEEYAVCFEPENKKGTGGGGAGDLSTRRYTRDELMDPGTYEAAVKAHPDGQIPMRD